MVFPADFIILDLEADKEVPIILGRPFLATGRTLIDVQKGELTMRVNEQEITFNVFNALKFPNEGVENCFFVSTIHMLIQEQIQMDHEKLHDELADFHDEEVAVKEQLELIEQQQFAPR